MSDSMTGDEVTSELKALGLQLAEVMLRFKEGERSSLYPELRMLADAAVCLLEDSPEYHHTLIGRLVYRCEMLILQVVN